MAEPSTTTPCVVCGRAPTRSESIRRHVGIIVMQRFVKLQQPLCREHGIEITNTYLRKTMIEGWWGFISFFVNFGVVASDLVVLVRYRALDEPRDIGRFLPPPTPPPPPAQGAAAPASGPAPAPGAATVAPGWYPDPSRRYEHRWHDGRAWTSTVATQGQQYHDPSPLA